MRISEKLNNNSQFSRGENKMITTVTKPIISLFERPGKPNHFAKVDPDFLQNAWKGKGNSNESYIFAKEVNDLKQNYFIDERGKMKLGLVTGTLVDANA
jgi:hypothetical protein